MGKHNQSRKLKGSNASLGKSLTNNLNKKTTKKTYVSDLHRLDDRATKDVHTNLNSVLEQDSLVEFTDLVNLSKRKFEVEKRVHLMEGQEAVKNPNTAIYKSIIEEGIIRPIYAPLKLPRKPKWNKQMSKEELVANENQAFLEWRRDVAMMEEGNVSLAITPFEKNLAVWKQLWSVVEKCQVLVQIVDARNPYFFYSADLEKYIKELDENKHYLLLLNKADYLDETQIQHWNQYFKEKGVEHIFFSALNESSKETKPEFIPKVGIPNEMLSGLQEAMNVDDEETIEMEAIDKMVGEEKVTLLDSSKVYSREELLRLIRVFIRQRCAKPEGKDGRYTVGMVGYPNVGKSSVINVLLGTKKVGVASRPGKTKHFQTIYMGNDICLCDCPGLVFPSFASSRAEMVC
jgi:large subunit GTPase 1